MNPWLATAVLAAAAWLGFALLTSPLVGWLWTRRERCSPGRSAGERARAAERCAGAAVAAPTALLALCLLPGALAWLGAGDHCSRHAEHLHLCPIHPAAGLAPAGLALVALVWTAVLASRARPLAAALGRLAAGRRLAALQGEDAGPVVRVVSERMFSVTAGSWRPRIWLSEALRCALAPEQLEVVLAHERAHARRRDPLRAVALSLCSLPLGHATRTRLLRVWSLASEQDCDEQAAREVGDRLRVAETILAVERLVSGRDRRAARALPAFGGGDVEARVRSLLEPGLAESPLARRPLAALGIVVLAIALAATGTVHHLTEHVLDALLGR